MVGLLRSHCLGLIWTYFLLETQWWSIIFENWEAMKHMSLSGPTKFGWFYSILNRTLFWHMVWWWYFTKNYSELLVWNFSELIHSLQFLIHLSSSNLKFSMGIYRERCTTGFNLIFFVLKPHRFEEKKRLVQCSLPGFGSNCAKKRSLLGVYPH